MMDPESQQTDQKTNLIPKKFPSTYESGLWKKSRHPNLFYELIAWIGFTVMGVNDWSNFFILNSSFCHFYLFFLINYKKRIFI